MVHETTHFFLLESIEKWKLNFSTLALEKLIKPAILLLKTRYKLTMNHGQNKSFIHQLEVCDTIETMLHTIPYFSITYSPSHTIRCVSQTTKIIVPYKTDFCKHDENTTTHHSFSTVFHKNELGSLILHYCKETPFVHPKTASSWEMPHRIYNGKLFHKTLQIHSTHSYVSHSFVI